MDEWNILDKQANPEDYQPVVCDNNDVNDNFSISIIAVLENTVKRRPKTSIQFCIKLPYICIYFDNVLLVVAGEKCQLKLLKTFEINVNQILILAGSNVALIILENGDIINVNLNNGQQDDTGIALPKGNFTPRLMYEQHDGSVLIINTKGLLYNHFLIVPPNNKNETKYNIEEISHENICDDSRFYIDLTLKRMKPIHKSSLCICPSLNRNITTVCPITGQNFILNESTDTHNIVPFENNNKLIFMKDVDMEKCNLHIATCFDLKIQLTTEVTKNCIIVGGIKNDALYVDFTKNKLYVSLIQEISPILQLEILISLRNYEAAELFAKTHNLSPTAVLEIKAKCLVNQLKKECSEDLLKELINVLSSCDNINFVVNCCIDGVEANFELWPLLEFAKKKLLNANDINLNLKIDKLLWKIEVFRLFSIEEIILDWKTLIDENPIDICKKLLNNDLLDHASVVWLKSYRFIYSDLKINDVINMLCSISQDVKLSSLLWWLEYFIPNVISIMPHVTDLIIDWAKDRICILENSPHWPEIGIQFAEKFVNLIFNTKGIASVIPTSADKIYSLIKCMQQIQILKKTYNIIVTLRDFTTLSTYELVKFILRKAFNEDLQALFTNYIDNFMIRHNLNHDAIIREYIEELLGLSPTIDEQKMLILIDNIFNMDEKYQCIILVLKSASIPWSASMKKISQDVIESRHPLSVQVHTEILHADMRSILVKYKCLELSSEDYDCLINLIVEKGDPEMMNDIEKITRIYSYLKEDAYLLYITKLIEKGNILTALDVYNAMDENFKEICYYQLSVQLEERLKCQSGDKKQENNYLDFLKCISKINDYDLECFHKIYILKNKFQLYISLKEYYIKEHRRYVLIKWCQERNNKKSGTNIKEMLLLIIQVGSYLSLSKTECISILMNGMNKDFLSSLAEIILSEKYFLDRTIDSLSIIVNLIPLLNLDNIVFLENALFCVTNILQNCNSKHMSFCLEVHNWLTSIHFAHSSTKKLLSMWKISPFYNPHIINSIIPIWKEVFNRNYVENFSAKAVNLCRCPLNRQCRDGSCLEDLINKLQQNDIYSMKILAHYVNWSIQNEFEISAWFLNSKETIMKNLITKIVTSDKPDNLLASNLMLTVSSRDEWLNGIFDICGFNMKKIHFAKYILNCKNLYQYATVYKQAYNINQQCNIEDKLESYGLMLKNNHDGSQTLISLLESLVNVKSFSIDVLLEYCLISNINVDNALTSYLFLLLKLKQNDYKFINYTFGNCKIVSEINMQDVLEKCLYITSKIIYKDELVQNLIAMFRNGEVQILDTIISISRYCYEAYLIIIDLLKHITGTQTFLREYLLLKFLQTYQRIDKPKQTEIDEFSLKETFPKIGFYRLPFHFLISENLWNNLKPEVTLATYKQWLPIAGLLLLDDDVQVSRDKICSNAVRQSMTVEKMNKNTNITWCLYMKNKRLLEDAHKCIENISNLEWAGACFYYVYQCSPFGADQVAAADFCYQFAEHWAKIEPNNNAVKKMQMKHLLTSSAHILHKYSLGEDKLLSLCDNPHKLIEALYCHKSIITNYECTNINNAVNEIAEKHNLNFVLIKMQIFSRILNMNMTHSDASISNKYTLANDGSLNKELLMRACYILKGTNLTTTILYLHRMSLNIESMENHNKSIRALQCLLSLADDDLMMKNLQCTTKDIWSKFWELYFINCLHLTGFEYLLTFFHENKTQLIQQMCSNTRDHNKLTIALIVKMMFVYNVKVNDAILDELCKSIIKFNMMSNIREFLISSRIIYGTNYINMWNHILLAPFNVLDSPLIEQQKNDCCEVLRLLPICPVLSFVDLNSILSVSVRLNATEFALIILPYLSNAERTKAKNRIGKIKKSTLQELKVLKSKGISMTNIVMAIMKQT